MSADDERGKRRISQHRQAHVDIAASGIRIRTHDVGLLDERLGLAPRQARKRHAQLGFYPEASRNGPETDGALNRDVRGDTTARLSARGN